MYKGGILTRYTNFNVLKTIMKKNFYNILTLSLAVQTFIAPTYSFAESAEKSVEIYTDEQALKSIEEHAKQHRDHEETNIEIAGEYLLLRIKQNPII